MAAKKLPQNARLDINSPEFLTGLKWEKISSVKPAPGMQADALYSLRIHQGGLAALI